MASFTARNNGTLAALITGVAGQDGSYLAEFLLNKNYEVYGMARYCSEKKHERIEHIKTNSHFHLIEGDLTDTSRIMSIVSSLSKYSVVEIYNLGAQSHVQVSFGQPEYTANVDAVGTLRILEAIHQQTNTTVFKFYQAGTSEMFGKIQEPIQNENTSLYPRSPYGCAKVYSYWITKNYRESYGMFACTGILFNHESERRGPEFVTRKITLGLAEFMKNKTPISLGNIDARRDWGHAQDYVEAMWLMLQRDVPDDYVIGTGKTHTVRDFINEACNVINLPITWSGEGVDEVAKTLNGDVVIKIDPQFYRPSEVDVLIADARKAYVELSWLPKIDFKNLVSRMVNKDVTC